MRTTILRRTAAGLLMILLTVTAAAAQQPSTPSTTESTEARIRALEELVARLSASGAASATTPATGTKTDELAVVEALASKLEDLDQQLRVLQRKLEIEKEQATEKAKVTPTVVAGREGYAVKSADGDFQLKFRGYVQADGRFVGDSDGTSGPTNFVLRRVRPVLEATAFKLFDFKLMPDFGQGTTSLQDAYADLKFVPWLKVRAGKFKGPFGLERLESATELTFVERGTPTNIAPNRVQAFGDLAHERISYAVGIFNGVVDGGSTDTDDHSGKDVEGRVFFLPFKKAKSETFQQLGLGVAGSDGSQRGTLTTPNLPTYKTAAQQTFFKYRSDGTATGTTFADGQHWRFGPQAYYYVGSVGFLTEYYVSSQRVRLGTKGADVQSAAWQVSGQWALTGEKESYRGIVSPRRNFDRQTGGWGGFELTARVGQQTIDDTAFPVFANPSAAARAALDSVVGVNWFVNKFVKLTGQYENINFDGGAPNGGDRSAERGVFTRVQFAF
jgi:phosphate-selective porin OprO and OprP